MNLGELAQGLIPAATGLIGVWWGGRISSRASREIAKQEDQRRRRTEIIEVRAAARLLTEQLFNVKLLATTSLENRRWISPGSSGFDSVVWETSRTALARLLDEPEWSAVLKGVESSLGFGRLAEDLEGPLVDPSQDQILSGIVTDINLAIETLRFHRAAGDLLQSSIAAGVR